MALYTCGHIIPDSDSVCSAISLAYLLNKIGRAATPARQGELNPETKFILDKFGFEAPVLKTSFAGDELFITDYSDIAQAPQDLDKTTVVGIVDHHKLGDITTSAPLECWIRPVGCTNTIVKEMYDYHKVEIPANIAAIMMCAILSDTVIFKSPTCTPLDIQVVKELSKICGIEDFGALGMEMFKVKSEVEGTPIRDLVMRDYKNFDMHGSKVGVGQLEVVDGSVFDKIKDDLMADIKKVKDEQNLHTVALLLTDIMKEGSEVLVASNDTSIFEKAFNCKLEDGKVWLDGCLSRKKQIIPFLEPAFA
ncbi:MULTISPECIES: manganese-dependent inorganic pyrophosphatase [Aliarcobacter]|jgi:manganese-dependent inorganic pyrophosphatase|uniref:inorganic diphosphatase n=1 Tax=Aliarcobacter skirrowii TaxID=28200 RepID=A0AAW9D908_9BACT|nr:manganese-dependent inorganic pyrophosphatase [Aliarcobacter skirrowii]MDD2508000.1 manganese-dependent inorganic pyrophosphatase [Aliarcobacter skirrowii]MDD3496312.1 manganese-dependent inorganic pyrophosphatase [Aliarcobacter skirrowii]MDX4068670.1 manganese-dependent inorganic pyrophosphatase [Aliarcobacter skirrowii]MDX4070641.1 manganese-dependent inorganic pyrophosphatase [Aliarcobacter skirrowii]